jgi:urease accessory protein
VLVTAAVGGAWLKELDRLHGGGLWLGISPLRRGGWSLRLVAEDSVRLRQGLREVRRILAGNNPRLAADLRKL